MVALLDEVRRLPKDELLAGEKRFRSRDNATLPKPRYQLPR
jgi:hypothetical protein